MIVSFPKTDSRAEELIGILKSEHIDFEHLVFDRQVFHILGQPTPRVQSFLQRFEWNPENLARRSETFALFESTAAPPIIAGPCAVESRQQIDETAAFLAENGIRFIRGGVFKPRTSPLAFQGLGIAGLEILKEAAERFQLRVVTEVLDRSQIQAVAEVADILQVGSRNMFNYTLLIALGAVDKPVLLKRGMSATIDEWLYSAEYVLRGGNRNLILCERGIRTFEPQTRNTLDVAAIPIVKARTNLPVVADPSHAAGRAELVPALAKAAAAAGADGLMIEIHPQPKQALSDAEQALTFDAFVSLLKELPFQQGRP